MKKNRPLLAAYFFDVRKPGLHVQLIREPLNFPL